MRPTVIEKKSRRYDKMAEAVLFETQKSAQAILDDQYPGHRITVSVGDNCYAEIYDKNGKVVVRMSW